jgi:hypothetical protein
MGTFDTALMEALLSVGISPERARAVVDSFDRSIDSRYGLHAQVLATKRDLAETQTRLMREIGESRERIAALAASAIAIDGRIDRMEASLGARIQDVNAALHARIDASNASLAARIAETKTDLLKWTLGALTAQTALLLSAMKHL